MSTDVTRDFAFGLPKAELHLHLEGTITPRTLIELAGRNGVQLPATDEAAVAALFRYRDFGEFLSVYMGLARAIVTGDDFARLAYELGHDLAAQHVRYAEVMISPMQHITRGVNLYEAIEGAMAGFARAGLLQRTRGALVLPDPAALRAMVDAGLDETRG